MLLMGKSTMSMAIFHCHVSSPEGMPSGRAHAHLDPPCWMVFVPANDPALTKVAQLNSSKISCLNQQFFPCLFHDLQITKYHPKGDMST